jgi:phenylacetate-coenzyme A ligase PaaK-like adenylate-forming protein
MMSRYKYTTPDPVRSAFEQWSAAALTTQVLCLRVLGPAAIHSAGQARFYALTRTVRERSPFYRDAWKHLPAGPLRLARLPVVTKGQLMAAFDDWCTDREVTRAAVDQFIGERAHIGDRFLDRYLVWMSSGSTGEPGIYIQDAGALATYDALVSAQVAGPAFAGCDWQAVAASGGRAALITADTDHFASIASWRRLAQGKPWLDMKSFAVTQPVQDIVRELNAYQPTFLSSYPTVLSLLADEQAAGRLAIRPAALWSGGEGLSLPAQRRIERDFRCPLQNEYGASECLTIGHGCREGFLHVDADWVLLEPVDRDHRPTPPGELSHTVLLTNLANVVQPIIRYDLGDSVRFKAGACACGSPLPAIHVEGRSDDVLSLRARDGTLKRLVPLALTTVIEDAAHIHRFQVVQSAHDCLALRLMDADRVHAAAAQAALRAYLDRHGLTHVKVVVESGQPQPSLRGGKLRQVVALRDD